MFSITRKCPKCGGTAKAAPATPDQAGHAAHRAFSTGHPLLAAAALALKAGKVLGLYARYYRCTKCNHFYMPS